MQLCKEIISTLPKLETRKRENENRAEIVGVYAERSQGWEM
jgi:hypothetical protein